MQPDVKNILAWFQNFAFFETRANHTRATQMKGRRDNHGQYFQSENRKSTMPSKHTHIISALLTAVGAAAAGAADTGLVSLSFYTHTHKRPKEWDTMHKRGHCKAAIPTNSSSLPAST